MFMMVIKVDDDGEVQIEITLVSIWWSVWNEAALSDEEAAPTK